MSRPPNTSHGDVPRYTTTQKAARWNQGIVSTLQLTEAYSKMSPFDMSPKTREVVRTVYIHLLHEVDHTISHGLCSLFGHKTSHF
jgi:hypothetical protein